MLIMSQKTVKKVKKGIKKPLALKKHAEKLKSGQPTKLTPELQKKICDLIAKGNSFKNSCLMCDISQAAFCNWQKLGREGKAELYVEFFERIKKAKAKFIEHHLENITTAGDSDAKQWPASAWLLERSFPDLFGRKYQIDQTITKQKRKTKNQARLEQLSNEELQAEIEKLKGENNAAG